MGSIWVIFKDMYIHTYVQAVGPTDRLFVQVRSIVLHSIFLHRQHGRATELQLGQGSKFNTFLFV